MARARTTSVPRDVLDGVTSERDRLKAQVDVYDKAIEELCLKHKPRPDEEALRPGNAGRTVNFYCTECGRQWPCQVLNDLRALYGKAHDWPDSLEPMPPLTMKTGRT